MRCRAVVVSLSSAATGSELPAIVRGGLERVSGGLEGAWQQSTYWKKLASDRTSDERVVAGVNAPLFFTRRKVRLREGSACLPLFA